MEYRFVSDSNLTEFEKKVNELAAQGFRLLAESYHIAQVSDRGFVDNVHACAMMRTDALRSEHGFRRQKGGRFV